MGHRKRQALSGAAILAFLTGSVGIAIQVDRWRIERQQMVAQMKFETTVRECEMAGGRWWRGACEPVP